MALGDDDEGDDGPTSRAGTGLLVAAFVATRTLVLLCVVRWIVLPGYDPSSEVTKLYHHWYAVFFRHGTFPLHEVSWQYPPGAAAAMLAPRLLPWLSYGAAFIVEVLAADLAAFLLLLRVARNPLRSRVGVWMWVVGTAMIGPTIYARYDLWVTVLAIAGLLLASRSSTGSGALAGVGAALKVWPALVVVGAPPGREGRRTWVAMAAAAAITTAVFTATFRGGFAFLGYQRARGTEIESVGGVLFQVLRFFHQWPGGRAAWSYGSMEFLGPHVTLVSDLAILATVASGVWLLVWRWRARLGSTAAWCDAAFTAVLLFTTTSRVLSPQYLVWLVGMAAVCLTWRATVQAIPSLLVLVATALTGAEYPALFHDVSVSNALGVVLIAARNGLLVAASLLACRNLWRATVPPGAPAPHRARSAEDGDRASNVALP